MGSYGPVSYGAPKWDGTSPKTWPEWTDVLGQTYRPGDYVAVSVINGRSPQMVIGKVIQINRVDSKNNLIVELDRRWEPCDEHDNGARFFNAEQAARQSRWASVSDKDMMEEGWYKTVDHYIDSCTVKVQPLLDARGFGRTGTYRWAREQHMPRSVVYRLWENVLKVDGTEYEAKMKAQMDAMAEDLVEILDK